MQSLTTYANAANDPGLERSTINSAKTSPRHRFSTINQPAFTENSSTLECECPTPISIRAKTAHQSTHTANATSIITQVFTMNNEHKEHRSLTQTSDRIKSTILPAKRISRINSSLLLLLPVTLRHRNMYLNVFLETGSTNSYISQPTAAYFQLDETNQQ